MNDVLLLLCMQAQEGQAEEQGKDAEDFHDALNVRYVLLREVTSFFRNTQTLRVYYHKCVRDGNWGEEYKISFFDKIFLILFGGMIEICDCKQPCL